MRKLKRKSCKKTMVRFNKRDIGALNPSDGSTMTEEIDWKQFIVDYHNLSVDQAIQNIITKVNSKLVLAFGPKNPGIESQEMCVEKVGSGRSGYFSI